ncbi:MAG TPA: coproporphyrinogen III oxidase [Chloroflexi bacterium]|nr:coproporphyrinogen III oxidase [Chloroflexota bacterium]
MNANSVYLHIPFCRHRCAYCDFNTFAGQQARIPDYVEALQREIQALTAGAAERLPVHTVYFGGGTPSLLPISAFEQILTTLARGFLLSPEAEISIEANPGTLTADYLQALRATGVNRLSLGMQSADPGELIFLERQHQFEDVINAVTWARQAGFNNLSLDLIFGLPEQHLGTWEASLDRGLALAPEHFSLYALTIEHGTPLKRQADLGLIPAPDPDLAAEMYELACAKLTDADYLQYEISNWAKENSNSPLPTSHSPFLASQHNLQYWRNQPYFGFGAGAHGFVSGFRTRNVLAPAAYIRRMSLTAAPLEFPRTPATVNAQSIDRETEIGETMMMGLRLTREGVSDSRFQARFGVTLREIYDKQIDKFVAWGLLEWADDHLRLTERGYLLGNQIFSEFI